MNIVEPIFAQCRNKPLELALCAPGTEFNLASYARLQRSVNNICQRIISAGIAPRSRVAVVIDDPIFHAMMLMALTRLGIITVSITDRNISWPIALGGVVADRPLESQAAKTLLADATWTTGNDQPVDEKHLYRAAPGDICRIVLTSANDGQQNAIALTHGMIATRLDRQKLFFGPRAPFCERTHLDLPLATALGFQVMLGTLWRGGALVMTWDARKTLAALAAYNVQNMIAAPQSLLKFADAVENHPGYRSNLAAVFSAGSMASDSLERVRARLCANLTVGYAARDATMVASMPSQFATTDDGASGLVLPGVTVEIVDERDLVVPPGQSGNLRIRSDYGVKEYLDEPSATQRDFRGGWFYPGERGHLTSDNVLFLSSGTANNAAADVERVEEILSKHANVVQCGVLVRANEFGANELYALVVPRSYLDAEALSSYCKARLPSGLVPTRFVAVSDLPRNPDGNVDRTKLPPSLKKSSPGKTDTALATYDHTRAARSDDAETLLHLGNSLKELKRFEEALASYDRALTVRPEYAEALCNRGLILHELKRFEEALASYDRALTLRPDSAEVLCNRGVTLHELKRFEEAVVSYDRALTVRPDFADAIFSRGEALKELKRFDEAVASYNEALALEPNHPDAFNNMGNLLKELGQLQQAQEAYLKAIRCDSDNVSAYYNLADSKHFTSGDPHLAAMEALAAKTERLSKTDRMQLDFALGKAYADLKDYHRSFQHLLEGNAAKRAMVSYDEKSVFAWFERIEAVFTPQLIKAKSGGGDPSPTPIIILGMPRSGTTLVEQIIASHPMVHGAGELGILNDIILAVHGPHSSTISFPELVRLLDTSVSQQIGARYVAAVRELGPTSKRVTDKTISNFFFVGLIHLALPNAKIIHVVRDPVDTCVSCFTKLFVGEHNYTYNLGELGRYYKRYERLMTHWRRILPPDRILDVRYEEVVADLEGQARRVISHSGLPWDERCVSFHTTTRPVGTASAVQVRQPIYKSAVGRWRVYGEYLAPLLSALGIVTSAEA
jgi:tetratricopeptide (TPR) repeat protein